MRKTQSNLAPLRPNTAILELDRPDVANTPRYCLYARKSTESDEMQILSIDSQVKEAMESAVKECLNIVEVKKESHSAKDSGCRPVFNQMIAEIKQGRFNGILCWAPDRLSRNAGDLGAIVDLMDSGLIVDIRTHGQRFTNSPNEKFLLMILCSQAKLENDHKGENVKRGLRAKCEQGWRPGVAPLGYIHDKYADKGQKRVLIDKDRAPLIKRMFEKVAYDNESGRNVYKWLNDIKFTTRSGKKLTLSGVYRILNETFYYGEFEYPVGGGKYYQGNHDSIINKELFIKARENLTAPPRRHPGTIDFAFTKLLYCGACGSGISAEEKFKHQKNGNTHRYVYYHCTRGKDRNCREGAIREEDLLSQLVVMADKIDINEIAVKDQIKKEVERFRKFSYGVLGKDINLPKRSLEIDMRNYVKYILADGTKEEKRDLLASLKSKLVLKDKKLELN